MPKAPILRSLADRRYSDMETPRGFTKIDVASSVADLMPEEHDIHLTEFKSTLVWRGQLWKMVISFLSELGMLSIG